MKKYLFSFIAISLLTSCANQEVKNTLDQISVSNTVVSFHLAKLETGLPVGNFTIDDALLSCTEVPITNGESSNVVGVRTPTSPKEWCGIRALNLPVITDSQGNALLEFFLTPSPEKAGIKPSFGPEYNVPMLQWKSGERVQTSGIEAISTSEWATYPTYGN